MDSRSLKKLLVTGCSVAHGTDLINTSMHRDQPKLTYGGRLAEMLGLEQINEAVAGGSNDYIFHSAMDMLGRYYSEAHSAIVMWTSPTRLVWKNNEKWYIFGPNSARALTDLYLEEINPIHSLKKNGAFFHSDTRVGLDDLATAHEFFIRHYFDVEEEEKKKRHHKSALAAYYAAMNVPLIQLEWTDIDVGSWIRDGRHPSREEHKDIARLLKKRYYED